MKNEELCVKIKIGDKKAEEEIIRKNAAMVISIVRKEVSKYKGYINAYTEDLISVGKFSLIQAAKKYNPMKKTTYATYAYYVVRKNVQKEIMSFGVFDGVLSKKDIMSGNIGRYESLMCSIDEPIISNPFISGNCHTYHDILPDETADVEKESDVSIFDLIKNVLSSREYRIIKMRYESKLTLQEIADYFQISKERARQIHNDAINKIKNMYENGD